MFTSGNGGNGEARSTTTVQKIETTTTTSVATTTTEQVVTTTTKAATTTTTLDATAEIEAFVEEFAAAIEREDVDSLLATLHRAVLETFDEEVCQTFIENEILLLGDYRLTGDLADSSIRGCGGGRHRTDGPGRHDRWQQYCAQA